MSENCLPLVSIIIPVYNVEKYICNCIDSVLAQDYHNIEIIIVDDGSPDNSGKIADEYAGKDNRIHVIHKENQGVAAARNSGFDASTGEFIIYIDSDDWISKDHVSYLMELHSKTNADMCMTTEFFTQKQDLQVEKENISVLSSADAAALLLSPKVVVGSYNKLYKKKYLSDNNIRQNENLFSGEGLNYIVTAAQYANFVAVSNRKIYYYRRNVAESATTKFNINMFLNNELSLDLIEKNKIVTSDKFNSMLELFRINLSINGILAIINNSKQREYQTEYNRWKKTIQKNGRKLLKNKYIPLKSKVRIIGVIISPKIWSILAKHKRNKIYKNSV